MSSSSSSSIAAAAAANGIYISNVDDYVSPSQACINPIFSAPKPKPKPKPPPPKQEQHNGAGVIPPSRRRRKPRTVLTTTSTTTTELEDSQQGNVQTKKKSSGTDETVVTVQASLADCLACSGCVTTTETVLMEQQHSISVVRDLIWNNNNTTSPSSSSSSLRMLVTISPAAWADIARHLHLPTTTNAAEDDVVVFRQFTTVLYQLLGITTVLDGNVPLLWSLQEAAVEFCQSYRQQQQQQSSSATIALHEQWQQKLWPSQALSKHEVQFRSLDNEDHGTIHAVSIPTPPRQRHVVPLLASSCPAVVCMVEKTAHAAVPHLSTVPSPMSLAGAALANNNNNKRQRHYHIAVMPCHDKKLEASRKDFYEKLHHDDQQQQQQQYRPLVDMVLTTTECLTLLHEALERRQKITTMEQQQHESSTKMTTEEWNDLLQNEILQAPLAPVTHILPKEPPQQGLLLTTSTNNNNLGTGGPFVYGSGGYADYIFRHACRDLFGYTVGPGPLPWQPVMTLTSNTNTTTTAAAASVRMAAAAQRRKKDFYQIILYECRQSSDDSEFFHTMTPPENDNAIETVIEFKPVLRFALAYGMQTLQRVLKQFQQQQQDNDKDNVGETLSFDYIEAMACPSGCLNGGGQLRLSAKETPTETRTRLDQTQQHFVLPTTTPIQNSDSNPQIPLNPRDLYTTYHVVPPLQLSMGAAAGVAVQDLQW